MLAYAHSHRHTHTFTCVHTRMHAVSKLYMHAHTRVLYMLIHANMYACVHIHMLVHMYTHIHTHISPHEYSRLCALIHMLTYLDTHSCSDMRTHFPAFSSSTILLHFSFPVKPSWQWLSFPCSSAHFSDFYPPAFWSLAPDLCLGYRCFPCVWINEVHVAEFGAGGARFSDPLLGTHTPPSSASPPFPLSSGWQAACLHFTFVRAECLDVGPGSLAPFLPFWAPTGSEFYKP